MLKIKKACICSFPEWVEKGSHFLRNGRCPFCGGTKEVEHPLTLQYYKGKFKRLNWKATEIDERDICINIQCPCGDYVFFSEGFGMHACSCGRIYKFTTNYSVDDTYIGNQEALLEEFRKEREEEAKRMGIKSIDRILGLSENTDL